MSSQIDQEQLEQLISEELSGVITPADQSFLDNARNNDPEIQKLWEEKRAAIQDFEVQHWLETKIVPPYNKTPSGKRNKRSALLLLLILAVFTGGYYFLHLSGKKTAPADAIQLRRENGEAIDLSQPGEVRTGNTSLLKKENELVYTTDAPSEEWVLLSVPGTKDYKVTLSDGTEIYLNAATTLRFPLSFDRHAKREVIVNGEAYFKVTGNAGWPFIVKLEGGDVAVLGTEFNINNYDKARPNIGLVTGKLQFKAGKDSVILQPGFAATLVNNKISTGEFDADELLSWREGIFKFNDMPLKEVLETMNRLFEQKVVLDNPDLERELFSGGLNKKKTIRFNLDLLKVNNRLRYYIDEDSVIHIK